MMKAILSLLPALFLLLQAAACASPPGPIVDPGAAGKTPLPPAPGFLQETATPFQPGAPEPAASLSPVPDPAQTTGFFGLQVPADWYFRQVEADSVAAIVMTMQDPQALEDFEAPGYALPPGFAAAALALSPLPAGADLEALQAGLEQVEAYTSADLESLLVGADRIGLVDLASLDSVRLLEARRSALGGRPALEMRGRAEFVGGLQPELEILVRLTWTGEGFFAFYALAGEGAWEGAAAAIFASMETVELP